MFSSRIRHIFGGLQRRDLLPLACLLVVLAITSQESPSSTQNMQVAYIGPGAGIALVGSFLAVLGAMLTAFMVLLTWPIRWCWRSLRGQQALKRAQVKRVVVLGLDGLDPELVETFMEEGILPNLKKLGSTGSYHRLGTTWPPLSPVAWSSFSTGSNPGKHRIFDFIARNPLTYLPEISSVRIQPPRRQLKLGNYCLPLSRPRIDGLRKSKPFWQILGEAGIFSTILRVPITFPPDRFHGVQLSAMCVPDLRGTQGMFTYFAEQGDAGAITEFDVGGERIEVRRSAQSVHGTLPGPVNPLRTKPVDSQVSFRVVGKKDGTAVMHVAGQTVRLVPGQYTDWVRLPFRLATGVKAHGLCRFLLKQFQPSFEMYCTPIHIDPDRPVMPISHPRVYSIYLARKQGPYATMGLAEDTWSLSEGLIDEEAFLRQADDINAERRKMFFDSLQRNKRGAVVCVFDGPDRIQHMFWRFQDSNHPNYQAGDPTADRHRHVIRDMYVRMDQLVGETLEKMNRDTALFVMSDHGFKPFRRGVDLNAWLLKHGYLVLKENAQSSDKGYLEEIDWSQTKAYALGLAGIYVNQQGREAEGIVSAGEEKKQLVQELCSQLTGLQDTDLGQEAIHQAISSEDAYAGPYVDAAPDLILGYHVGYRVSWDAAVGKCGPQVFSDNMHAWSGDHCIHPDLVPGVLFSNLRLDGSQPHITDLGPTTLELLGVKTPAYMDGKSLLCSDANS